MKKLILILLIVLFSGFNFAYAENGAESDVIKDIFIKPAEQGNIEAQYNLGVNYMSGMIFEKDIKQGVAWLTKAAEQGHVNAQAYLGNAYFIGEDVVKNYQTAYMWLLLATTQNSKHGDTLILIESVLTKEQIAESQTMAAKIAEKY